MQAAGLAASAFRESVCAVPLREIYQRNVMFVVYYATSSAVTAAGRYRLNNLGK